MRKKGFKRAVCAMLAGVLLLAQTGVTNGLTVYASDAVGFANSNFEDDVWNGDWTVDTDWTNDVTIANYEYASNEWLTAPSTGSAYGVNIWRQTSGDVTFSQLISSLPAGNYEMKALFMGEKADAYVFLGDEKSEATSLSGWNNWDLITVTFAVSEDASDVNAGFVLNCQDGGYAFLDMVSIQSVLEDGSGSDSGSDSDSGSESDSNSDASNSEATIGGAKVSELIPVDASVTVAPVSYPNGNVVSDDFITGADVSSFLSIINSGATYYDEDGNALDAQGFFDLLAAGGTNYIRLRVWNDPYDADGNGYGGGNNDLEAAKIMGQYATKAGMKVLIDFHYSDFWADPAKQKSPKAWASMTVEEKAEALAEYTEESIQYLLDAGVDVGMVQIGNETSNNLCDVSFSSQTEDCCKLFDAGCDAVHKVAAANNTEILTAIHFANPADDYDAFAKRLADNDVSYDVFATSYYPYWHGTIENLTKVLSGVAKKYNVKVMVAETSWANTLEDGDGHDNTVRPGVNTSHDYENYEFDVQGQCNEIRDVAQAVADIGAKGIGVFYWEPAWIPVAYAYNEDGSLNEEILASNKEAWETYGSGWATSYAGSYDAKDAGKWYGGSAVDNQAWFDLHGKALETVNVYNYIRTGAVSPRSFKNLVINAISIEEKDLADFKLPETVTAKYSDGTEDAVAVTWDKNAFAAAKEAGVGSYEIPGTVVIDEEEIDAVLELTISPTNLLTNGDFAKGTDGWDISKNILNSNDAATNSRGSEVGCLHFWTGTEGDEAMASQTVVLAPGKYVLDGYLQGGDAGSDDIFEIGVVLDSEAFTSSGMVNGWKEWVHLETSEFEIEEETEATVVVRIANLTSGVWGSFDDLRLVKVADLAKEDPEENPGTDDEKKDDTGKDDTGKDDTGKDDAGKDDVSKDDAGKDDAGKDDVSKDDAGKDDAGKDDVSKDDTDKNSQATPGDDEEVAGIRDDKNSSDKTGADNETQTETQTSGQTGTQAGLQPGATTGTQASPSQSTVTGDAYAPIIPLSILFIGIVMIGGSIFSTTKKRK